MLKAREKIILITLLAVTVLSLAAIQQTFPLQAALPKNTAPLATLPDFKNSLNPSVQKLDTYQNLPSRPSFKQQMIFTAFPANDLQATANAGKLTVAINEFSQFNLQPLIILEPSSGSQIIAYADIASGKYDQPLQNYFSQLKQNGIPDSQIGVWVPFPEPNIEQWGQKNSRPADFVNAFNRFTQIARRQFPSIKFSLLLNSQTYDYNLQDYQYQPLSPYLEKINPANLESFGLQGFPWLPPANAAGDSDTDPHSFINYRTALAAARQLNISSIWFNTGTFSKMYANDPQKTAIASPAQRAAILNGIAQEAIAAKKDGLNVRLNLFAQNKSRADEAIDWSYGDLNDPSNPHRQLLADFISQLRQSDIGISVFDFPSSQ